jgi:hypothetical protein
MDAPFEDLSNLTTIVEYIDSKIIGFIVEIE